MSDESEQPETEHVARLDSALAESQRLEREEQQADLDRQRNADERMIQALSQNEEQ